MTCGRCNYQFCWTCMSSLDEHRKWYKTCPGIQFSQKLNILLTVLFILFLPAVLVVALLVYCFYIPVIMVPQMSNLHGARQGFLPNCLVYSYCILCGLPISLAFGVPIGLFLIAIAILPLYILSTIFLVRICIVACKTHV